LSPVSSTAVPSRQWKNNEFVFTAENKKKENVELYLLIPRTLLLHCTSVCQFVDELLKFMQDELKRDVTNLALAGNICKLQPPTIKELKKDARCGKSLANCRFPENPVIITNAALQECPRQNVNKYHTKGRCALAGMPLPQTR
jgi:hypothetical protein